MGSLMTHEITIKSHDDYDKKKKGIAFKSSIKEEESSDEDDDEELAMMARRFKKFFRKRGQRFNQRCEEPFKKSFKEDPQKKEAIICYVSRPRFLTIRHVRGLDKLIQLFLINFKKSLFEIIIKG